MAYIIDTFNKYNKWDREHAQYTFSINECPYAIMEVPISNGLPQVQEHIDRDTYPALYRIYDTLDDALAFVKYIKQMNK